MKYFNRIKPVLFFGLLFTFTACAQKTTSPVTEAPMKKEQTMKKSKSGMTFDQQRIDIGMIKKGETKEIEYTFTNTGTEPIEISQVSTCDCTEVLKRPYLPVKPGEKGTIKVLFDSNKKDDVEPVEIDIWLEKEDPNTGMPLLERIEYIFKYKS
jgi:hypothetical protein